MRTNFFGTNFLNTPKSPGHPGQIPGTSRIPLFKTQGRQTCEGEPELFGHHPFAWKTPTPPRGLRTQKVNLCALFSCLKRAEKIAAKQGTIPKTLYLSHCLFLGLILGREEHSMDPYRSRLKLSENFEHHWSIQISVGKFIWTNHWSIPFPGENRMDQWS